MAGAHAYASMNHDEHRDMEEIGAQLSALLTAGNTDRAAVIASLNLLKASMLLHFAHEESVMKEGNYPNFFHHRRSHNYIMTELSVFIGSYAAGRVDTLNDIWPHLKKTLDTHMTKYDDDLVNFLGQA